MDRWGRTSIISAEDIDWNVGREKALPLLTLMEQRSQRIQATGAKLQGDLLELSGRLAPMRRGGVAPVLEAVQAGRFEPALRLVVELRAELSPSTLSADAPPLLSRLETVLLDLAELKREQGVTLSSLKTPDRYVVFWMTPRLVLIEIAFWSLFGLLTSLLWNTAEYRSKKQYRPAEQWVIYTKLVYAPFVAIVLVLALWAGLISIGGPESRVWMLPLLSFLIGFNIRKAVDLVDALSSWVLNRASESLRRTDAEREAAQAARVEPYRKAMPLDLLSDLRTEAQARARELVLREVTDRELKL
jgi:hypothetical protein